MLVSFDMESRECVKNEVILYVEDPIHKHVDGAGFVCCRKQNVREIPSMHQRCKVLRCLPIVRLDFRNNIEMSKSRIDINDTCKSPMLADRSTAVRTLC